MFTNALSCASFDGEHIHVLYGDLLGDAGVMKIRLLFITFFVEKPQQQKL